MNDTPDIIDAIDYNGKRAILTYDKWKEKTIIHPELTKKVFLKNLKETIENPEQVWQDKSDKRKKRCYYKKYSANSYVKAVVLMVGNPYYIISAFETNYIKETKYLDLKQLK